MRRWYFWVLAPIMVATAVTMLFVPAPASTTGQITLYVFSASLLLAVLGLADPQRFHWALRMVAAIVLVAGMAYFVSEFLAWREGKAIGGRYRSDTSLLKAALFLLVFGVPAVRFLIYGRSGTDVDVIAVDDSSRQARGTARQPRSIVHSNARPVFQDDILGAVRWDSEENAWIAQSTRPDPAFRILIAGDNQPDARLLPHARDLYSSPEPLLSAVPAALRAAADQMPEAAHEILGLHVESVALMWPRRPDDGMVYFDGPGTDERVWRCDYINRKLQPLGFDD